MKTLHPPAASTPPMASWEKVTLGLLVVAGIAGLVGGRSNLADRREISATLARQRLREIEQVKVDGARLVRESELAVERLRAVAAAPAAADRARADLASTPTGADPAARTAALGQVIDLMQKNVLTTTSTGLLLNQNAKPGQTLPAFMIDAEGRLAPGFGKLFGLTEDEAGRFQAIVTNLKQRADDLITSHTAIRPTENGYVLEYKAGAEAAQFRESAVAMLQSHLGQERYRMFAVLNGERVSDNGTRTGGPAALFNAMGGSDRTITLTRTATGLSYTVVGEGGGGGGSISGGDLSPALLRLGPVAQLIPQDFLNSIPRPPVRTIPGGEGSNLRDIKVPAPQTAPAPTGDSFKRVL